MGEHPWEETMSTFAELRAKQEQIEAERSETEKPMEVQVTFGGELITFHVKPVAGTYWASVTARCPARAESPIDVRYGYNPDAAARIALPSSLARLEGDFELPGIPKKKEGDENQAAWDFFFDSLSAPDLKQITAALWVLNQYNPEQLTESLKKASTADSTVKRDSLESSESVSSDSTAGNRAARRRTSTTKKAASPAQ
ncbi:hypothetical protein [Subtercola sp. YIM 133946]|uniref:hypothetical protein n=1 Tax=Subtercola sp. YIM 133946 TaxID=3118909 RepID=UPI002F91E87A